MRLALLLATSVGFYAEAQGLVWKVTPPAGTAPPVLVDGKLLVTGLQGNRLYTVAYDS